MSKGEGKSDKTSKQNERQRATSAPASLPRSMVLAQAAIARASRTSREALDRIAAFQEYKSRQRAKSEGESQPSRGDDSQRSA